MEMMGQLSVSIVVDGMNTAQEKRDAKAVHRKVAPELVVRESTKGLQ
jgi:DNA-binding LacI/PurR family transcriptional regulator